MGVGEGGRQLYLRSLDDFVDSPIPGTANPTNSFFSPDGKSIGFFAEGKLKKTSLAGGSPITLSDAPAGRSGDWFEDTIVFTASLPSGQGLYRVSANGGEPEMLATVNLDEGEQGYGYPNFLPDGKDLLLPSDQVQAIRLLYYRWKLESGKWSWKTPGKHVTCQRDIWFMTSREQET